MRAWRGMGRLVLLGCLLGWSGGAAGMDAGWSSQIVYEEEIRDDTGWQEVSLAGYHLRAGGITAVYLEIYLKVYDDNCGYHLRLELASPGSNTIRTFYIYGRASEMTRFSQYVWLPLTEEEAIQYRIRNFCSWGAATVETFKLVIMGLDS